MRHRAAMELPEIARVLSEDAEVADPFGGDLDDETQRIAALRGTPQLSLVIA